MLIKEIGVHECEGRARPPPASPRRRRRSPSSGCPMDGVSLVDGSGLARDNRVTCRALAATVDLGARPELAALWEGMAVAGQTGTLADELLGTGLEGRLRGKTGLPQRGHRARRPRRHRSPGAILARRQRRASARPRPSASGVGSRRSSPGSPRPRRPTRSSRRRSPPVRPPRAGHHHAHDRRAVVSPRGRAPQPPTVAAVVRHAEPSVAPAAGAGAEGPARHATSSRRRCVPLQQLGPLPGLRHRRVAS